MLFALYCLDKPNHQEVRAANRPAHVAHLQAQGTALVMAGPLLSDDGQAMIGSLIVIDCADRAALECFMSEDPYTKADLFQSVRAMPFRKALPAS